MELEQKVKILQMMYAGVLADSVLRMGKEDILEKVTQDKRAEQMVGGKARAAQLGIGSTKEVFEKLSDIFGCADWKTVENGDGFSASASRCMLCGIAKKLGAQSPCNIYCLDPMEAMVKGINPDAGFTVNETLWDGSKCSVNVTANI